MHAYFLHLLASAFVLASLLISPAARAEAQASAASTLSALPVASIVVGTSALASALVVVPVALSTAGAVLLVKTVESTARGTVYVLERASDGARVSIEVTSHSGGKASLAMGQSVAVSVNASGLILSAAGDVIAFVPNALGRALLHNERVTP